MAKIDSLWPEAVLTDDIRQALARRLQSIEISGEQFAAIAEDMRLSSRYRTPSTADLMTRCKAAAPKPRGERVVAARKGYHETDSEKFIIDGHDKRTLLWVKSLTDEQVGQAFDELDAATRVRRDGESASTWKPRERTRAALERSGFTRGMVFAACHPALDLAAVSGVPAERK